MTINQQNKFMYIEIARARVCILAIITHVMSPDYYEYINYSFPG